jgi:hypothetical protein
LHRRDGVVRWRLSPALLPLDGSPGSPWLLMPTAARAALDRVMRAGDPLARAVFGRPMLGVKCGCNAAFLVKTRFDEGDLAAVCADAREGWVERALLRPLVRGETLEPWLLSRNDERIVFTHDDSGHSLSRLPRHAERWLAPWRRSLTARSDARGGHQWWSLFRVEGAATARWRVVWADLGRAPRAALLAPGDRTVPLNSCYVLACAEREDALALAALLNSPLAAAWLGALAEPARGGFRRFLAWTVALLPIPADWPRARTLLAPFAERALARDPPIAAELLDAVMRAYRVRLADIEPLITWIMR